MKIFLIGPAYPLRGGGISTFNERLATELQAQGHDVVIYSFSLQYPAFLFRGKNQFTTEPAPSELEIRSVINSVQPLNWIRVGRLIKKERPDMIITRFWLPFMGPALGTILRIAKSNKHSRIICITDNIIPHEKRPGDRVFTRYFLRPIDGFVSMSRQVLGDLRKFEQKKKAIFVPHPVYDIYGDRLSKAESRALLGLPEAGKYILFFGFIRKYKGLDILFEAMADERVRRCGVQLIVAGEYYGGQRYYEDLIEKYQIRDSLHLYNQFIPNAEVRWYFSAADCVVQPYRSATQSGISQVAYHFEKPMIVTHVGGLPETVPDGKVGFVTEVNAQSVADKIVEFYEGDWESRFLENLKEEKKKYSWNYFIEQMIALYDVIDLD